MKAIRGAQGMTLAEMMITIVVMMILAATAYPNFTRAVEQGRWRSANDVLHTIYSGEQVYRTTNPGYIDPTGAGCGAPAWRCIYMDNPNGSPDVTFDVIGIGVNTFTARATRNGGPCNGTTQTLDQDRTLGGTANNAAQRWC